MSKPRTSRFAEIAENGEILSLVAEGLPEWSDDLTSFSDEEIGELHDAYVAEVREMLSDDGTLDPERSAELETRIPALREEAGRRFSEAEAATQGGGSEAPSEEELAARRQALGDLVGPDDADPGSGGGSAPELTSTDPQEVAAATARGVTEALAPLGDSVRALTETTTALLERVREPAPSRRLSAADLGRYAPDDTDPGNGATAPTARGRLVHRGDVPGLAAGHEFSSIGELRDAFIKRHRTIGTAAAEDEQVLVASYEQDDPPVERDLRGLSDRKAVMERIAKVCGPQAIGVDPYNFSRELPVGKGGIIVSDPGSLVASGGLAAPGEPYYAQLLLAEADRPVLGSMPGFVAERGGIRLVQPASLGTLTAATVPGLFADGVTNTDTSLVSATAAFSARDVGQVVVNAGSSTFIPAGTFISSVTNATTVVLSQATTGTGTGQSFYLPARNPNNLGGPVGLVTAAQDAAGPPNTVKFTYDVPLGTQVEFDVYSIYLSLQFANLTARTFPEQVELNIRLAAALAARVAETKALDVITGWSTLFTGAKTFGTARQLLAQLDHMAAYYRNHNRMDPSAVLRLLLPAWSVNAMRGDYISSFIGGKSEWGLSDDELAAWFRERNILPTFYWDGPSDLSQLFPSPGSGAINTNGVNSATPIAIPDYPGSGATTSFRTKIVSFMWGEGTWLGLSTGELNIGLVRDSILNSQNRFRNFEESWETPAFVGFETLRCVHTVASDGSYGAAVSVTLGAGSGL